MWWIEAILTGFLPALVGGLVGLVLGMLRWPLLLALLGGSATLTAGTNMAVSTVSAVGGTYKHLRERRFELSLFVWLGGAAIVGGFVGSFLTRALPAAALLWFIAALLLYEGARMLRKAGAPAPVAGESAVSGRRRHLAELAIGFLIGMLSGMVGMLLGSLRLPAMIRWLRVDARRAVGTNMAIGLVQGVAATAGHLAQGQVAPLPLVVVGLAALLGSYLGAHLTGRLPAPTLKRAIAVVLLLVGVAIVRTAWVASLR